MTAAGALAPARVPGLYAWAVTVAPLAWGRGSGAVVAAVAASAALLFLAFGPAIEKRLAPRSGAFSFWAFLAACAVAWFAAPEGLGPTHFDAARQVTGIFGWGLFAYASAARPLRRLPPPSALAVEDAELRARGGTVRGDIFYASVGILAALVMQLVALHRATRERALLVNFVTLAAGLAMIAGSTDLALARHLPRKSRSPKNRLRALFAPMILLAVLFFAGMLVANQGLYAFAPHAAP